VRRGCNLKDTTKLYSEIEFAKEKDITEDDRAVVENLKKAYNVYSEKRNELGKTGLSIGGELKECLQGVFDIISETFEIPNAYAFYFDVIQKKGHLVRLLNERLKFEYYSHKPEEQGVYPKQYNDILEEECKKALGSNLTVSDSLENLLKNIKQYTEGSGVTLDKIYEAQKDFVNVFTKQRNAVGEMREADMPFNYAGETMGMLDRVHASHPANKLIKNKYANISGDIHWLTVSPEDNEQNFSALLSKYHLEGDKAPNTLFVHLYGYAAVSYPIPLEADIKPDIEKENKPDAQYHYKLCSVVAKSGGEGGGHYVTYVKNETQNSWILANDMTPQTEKPIDLETLNKDLTRARGGEGGYKATLLCYCRVLGPKPELKARIKPAV
jgi:hypothetical protein